MIDAIKRLRNRDGSQRAQIHAALQRREVNPAEQISKRVPIVLKAGQRRGIARGPFPLGLRRRCGGDRRHPPAAGPMAARKGEPHCIGYQPRSPTYLAIFRETIKRYPGRDRRQVLLDLIEARGRARQMVRRGEGCWAPRRRPSMALR